MVGFHIQDYCLNFVDCCQRCLGCRVDRKNLLVEHGGRTVRVRPLPIGIPFDRFVLLAETANRVMQSNQKIVLGVDRLDYTKGLVHRLKAFEMLLEKHPEHRQQVGYHSSDPGSARAAKFRVSARSHPPIASRPVASGRVGSPTTVPSFVIRSFCR